MTHEIGLLGATTSGQSGPGGDCNKGVHCILQSSNITKTWPGYSLGVLPLCRKAVGVFYSPSRLSNIPQRYVRLDQGRKIFPLEQSARLTCHSLWDFRIFAVGIFVQLQNLRSLVAEITSQPSQIWYHSTRLLPDFISIRLERFSICL